MVCLLVLMPLSPASSTAFLSNSAFSQSWGSSWNPSFTYSQGGGSWQPSWTHSWQPSWSNSWHASWTNTWQPSWTNTWHQSWTYTWQPTWTNTWQPTWTNTWTWHTWSTQSYPTYTWSQYSPSYPWTQPAPGCYPYYPYCNGYYPPPNYNQVGLMPAVSAPGGRVSVQGYGFLPTDTTCTISGPNSPNLILNGSAACVIQSGTGIAMGGFIVGNVSPGSYIVQITGNQGDFAQAIISIE